MVVCVAHTIRSVFYFLRKPWCSLNRLFFFTWPEWIWKERSGSGINHWTNNSESPSHRFLFLTWLSWPQLQYLFLIIIYPISQEGWAASAGSWRVSRPAWPAPWRRRWWASTPSGRRASTPPPARSADSGSDPGLLTIFDNKKEKSIG